MGKEEGKEKNVQREKREERGEKKGGPYVRKDQNKRKTRKDK